MEAPQRDPKDSTSDLRRAAAPTRAQRVSTADSALKRSRQFVESIGATVRRVVKLASPVYRCRRIVFDAALIDARELGRATPDTREHSRRFRLIPRRCAKHPTGAVTVSTRIRAAAFPVTARLRYSVGEDFKEGLDVWLLFENNEIRRKLIHLPRDVRDLQLEFFSPDQTLSIVSCQMREVGKSQRVIAKGWAVIAFVLRHPKTVLQRIRKALQLYRQGGWRAVSERVFRFDRYPEWVQKYDTLTDTDRRAMREEIERWSYTPCVSIVLPVYNVPERFLRAVIESVRNQIYQRWELCIADDNSPNPVIRRVIEEYASLDPRIKYTFRATNGHIAQATNSAAALATGEFVGFLDHDDELRENALFWVVKELQTHRDAQLLYSDEDKITEQGKRHYPHFKSDWNPELLLAQNYVCHFTVVRRDIFQQVGGIRPGFDGAQDWDFVLRVSEVISTETIRHIPKILYHWRVIEGSTAKATEAKPYVTEAQIKAVSEHLARIGDRGAIVESIPAISMLRVRYPVPEPEPLVSLIIPTYNQVELLSTCVKGVLEQTTYKNIELIIVDNRSDDPATLRYLKDLQSDPRVKVIRDEGEFNFARLNNAAAREARGEILGFLNNDIQVVEPMWLHEMVAQVVRVKNAIVGARLLYPGGSVQHAGVILGVGGVADHMMKHLSADSAGYFGRGILPQNLSAVTAACMLVRGDVFKAAGGFDEEVFGVAYNDIDLCLRVRQRGYLVVYTPRAELIHHESVSRGYEDTPEKLARFTREFEAMRERWSDSLLRDPYYNANCSLQRADFAPGPPRSM